MTIQYMQRIQKNNRKQLLIFLFSKNMFFRLKLSTLIHLPIIIYWL